MHLGGQNYSHCLQPTTVRHMKGPNQKKTNSRIKNKQLSSTTKVQTNDNYSQLVKHNIIQSVRAHFTFVHLVGAFIT